MPQERPVWQQMGITKREHALGGYVYAWDGYEVVQDHNDDFRLFAEDIHEGLRIDDLEDLARFLLAVKTEDIPLTPSFNTARRTLLKLQDRRAKVRERLERLDRQYNSLKAMLPDDE